MGQGGAPRRWVLLVRYPEPSCHTLVGEGFINVLDRTVASWRCFVLEVQHCKPRMLSSIVSRLASPTAHFFLKMRKKNSENKRKLKLPELLRNHVGGGCFLEWTDR